MYMYIQEIQTACDYKMWIHVCARVYIQEIQSACDNKMWIHVCASVYTGDPVWLWLQDANTCMCTCIYRRFSLLVITRCEYMYVHVYTGDSVCLWLHDMNTCKCTCVTVQEIQPACDNKIWIHVQCMYTCSYRRLSLLVITRCEYMHVHMYR